MLLLSVCLFHIDSHSYQRFWMIHIRIYSLFVPSPKLETDVLLTGETEELNSSDFKIVLKGPNIDLALFLKGNNFKSNWKEKSVRC